VQTSALFSPAQPADLQHAGERASSAVEMSATEASQTARCASLPLSCRKGHVPQMPTNLSCNRT